MSHRIELNKYGPRGPTTFWYYMPWQSFMTMCDRAECYPSSDNVCEIISEAFGPQKFVSRKKESE